MSRRQGRRETNRRLGGVLFLLLRDDRRDGSRMCFYERRSARNRERRATGKTRANHRSI